MQSQSRSVKERVSPRYTVHGAACTEMLSFYPGETWGGEALIFFLVELGGQWYWNVNLPVGLQGGVAFGVSISF